LNSFRIKKKIFCSAITNWIFESPGPNPTFCSSVKRQRDQGNEKPLIDSSNLRRLMKYYRDEFGRVSLIIKLIDVKIESTIRMAELFPVEFSQFWKSADLMAILLETWAEA